MHIFIQAVHTRYKNLHSDHNFLQKILESGFLSKNLRIQPQLYKRNSQVAKAD
jgi:hypothetical protein